MGNCYIKKGINFELSEVESKKTYRNKTYLTGELIEKLLTAANPNDNFYCFTEEQLRRKEHDLSPGKFAFELFTKGEGIGINNLIEEDDLFFVQFHLLDAIEQYTDENGELDVAGVTKEIAQTIILRACEYNAKK